MGESVGAKLKHMESPFVTARPTRRRSFSTGSSSTKTDSGSSPRTTTTRVRHSSCWSSRSRRRISSSTRRTWSAPRYRSSPSSTAGRRWGRWSRPLGIPEGNLVATLGRYNEFAAKGEDRLPQERGSSSPLQDSGPWAAFDLSLGKAMYAGFTIGGMATSVDGEVLDGSGAPISGLYAAGACCGQHRAGRKGVRQRNPAR